MQIKTLIPSSKKVLAWTAFTTGVLLAGMVMAQPTPPPAPEVQTHNMILTTDGAGGGGAISSSGGTGSGRSVVRIESVEPDQGNEPAREVAWLGVSTEEVPEALASQLGLKSGQGLVVVFVAPDSPALMAGIQKYDVIDELGDQMLVDPAQLRKLVQMQKEGDTVKLALYRSGKKQTVSATLAKRTENLGRLSPESAMELSELTNSVGYSVNWASSNQRIPMALAVVDKQMVNAEVQRNMEEARKAIQEALRQSAQAGRAWPIAPVAPSVPALPSMVDFGNNSTVTVTKDGASVKTIVKSDHTGVLVIVANPKRHLTAHDQNGKLLFDGDIESPEQQKKLPAGLWEKVKPLLQQIEPTEVVEPQPHAQSGGRAKNLI